MKVLASAVQGLTFLNRIGTEFFLYSPAVHLLDKGSRLSTAQLADRLIHARQHVPFVQANLLESGADDFLRHPFDEVELRARIASLVRLKRYTDELESAESVILGLGATIEARDPCTKGHCQRLASYAHNLGRRLRLASPIIVAVSGRAATTPAVSRVVVPLLPQSSEDAG